MAEMDKTYRDGLNELVKRVGKSEARRLLVVEGISPHTADKLIGKRYPSKIGALLGGAILKVVSSAKLKAS